MSSVMRDTLSSLSEAIVGKKEQMLIQILDECAPGWLPSDIFRRCCWVRPHDSQIETLTLDGVPIFELHPLETELLRTDDGYKLVATWKYRNLRPAVNKSEGRK